MRKISELVAGSWHLVLTNMYVMVGFFKIIQNIQTILFKNLLYNADYKIDFKKFLNSIQINGP